MKHTKVGKSNGEISIRSLNHVKHHTMSRTVHWLEAMLFFSILNEKDVLFVFEVMPTHLPKLRVVHIGRNNFTVASDFVLRPHEFNKPVIDHRTVWVKQG